MTTPITIDCTLYDDTDEPTFRVWQDDDDTGLYLTVATADPTVELTIKAMSGGAAETLAHLLAVAAKEAKAIADAGWPDQDGDGFIGGQGYGPWYVKLEGVTYDERFDDRESAVLFLAEQMVKTGCFPACWEHNEWGHMGDSIDDEVRALHDEGGDQMAPFDYQGDQGPGQLADDTEIVVYQGAPGEFTAGLVFRDWGQHGIAWTMDPQLTQDRTIYLTPRSDVRVQGEEDA